MKKQKEIESVAGNICAPLGSNRPASQVWHHKDDTITLNYRFKLRLTRFKLESFTCRVKAASDASGIFEQDVYAECYADQAEKHPMKCSVSVGFDFWQGREGR